MRLPVARRIGADTTIGSRPIADLGQAEDGALGGDREVRRDGEAAAAGEREALHARDHRDAELVHRAHHARDAVEVAAAVLERLVREQLLRDRRRR